MKYPWACQDWIWWISRYIAFRSPPCWRYVNISTCFQVVFIKGILNAKRISKYRWIRLHVRHSLILSRAKVIILTSPISVSFLHHPVSSISFPLLILPPWILLTFINLIHSQEIVWQHWSTLRALQFVLACQFITIHTLCMPAFNKVIHPPQFRMNTLIRFPFQNAVPFSWPVQIEFKQTTLLPASVLLQGFQYLQE